MKKRLVFMASPIVSLCLVLVVAGTACGTKAPAFVTPILGDTSSTIPISVPAIVPYLPPAYYQCIQVLPVDIQAAYYSQYGNHAEAEALYTGKTFLFKDQLVDAYMIREINKGWLWADLTICPVINLDLAKQLKPGQRVDIIGICAGRDLSLSPGLVFRDCYVLITGSLQLPAPGGQIFNPTY